MKKSINKKQVLLTGFLPESMPQYWQGTFLLSGLILAILGVIALFHSVTVFRSDGFVPILFVVYTILSLSLAYGFITGKRWLVPILGLNWLTNFFLSSIYIYLSLSNSSINLHRNIIIIMITTMFFFYAYLGRKHLQGRYFPWLVSVPLLILWLLTFLFNFLVMLTKIPALKSVT